jgi:hypothetical protein
MDIALKSDFRDYYDHWFSQSHIKHTSTFERMTSGGMDRIDMLNFLNDIGLTTPDHGYVLDVALKQYKSFTKHYSESLARDLCQLHNIVVYTDINAHAGGGKELISTTKAAKIYPNNYCSTFVGYPSHFGISYRYLRIGKRQFWLRYTSANDWRSNCGNVTIELLCEEQKLEIEGLNKVLTNTPLFAVDFVVSDKSYAVDYNIAPMIKGTGIEDIMTPKEVFLEITQCL